MKGLQENLQTENEGKYAKMIKMQEFYSKMGNNAQSILFLYRMP